MLRENRKLTRDEYFDELRTLYGPHSRDWRVQCPACGKIYSLGECGEGEQLMRGLTNCIGRLTEQGGDWLGLAGPNEHGCNFAANGLFRSPWLAYESAVDQGEAIGVMPVADPKASTPAAAVVATGTAWATGGKAVGR